MFHFFLLQERIPNIMKIRATPTPCNNNSYAFINDYTPLHVPTNILLNTHLKQSINYAMKSSSTINSTHQALFTANIYTVWRETLPLFPVFLTSDDPTLPVQRCYLARKIIRNFTTMYHKINTIHCRLIGHTHYKNQS